MINFTAEQIAMARECKTVEALITFAKENNIELTEAEATSLFAQLNPQNGALSDRELKAASGGCSDNNSNSGQAKLKNVLQ